MRRFIILFLIFLGGGTPLFAQGAFVSGSITVVDGGTCSTAGGFVSIPTAGNTGAVAFSVSGTFSETLQFVGTVDGTNYVAVNAYPPNSTTAVTSTTSAGTWTVGVAGLASFCVRASAVTSGSATINMRNSLAVSASALVGGSGGGGGGGSAFSTITSGTNTTAAMVVGTGASLTVSGTGTVNATNINGTSVAGLATGPLCNTTATGVPTVTTLTLNVLVKGGGAGGCDQNSSVTDNATTVTTTDTGGYVAPVFVLDGTTATFMDFAQGTTSAAVAPCNTANSKCYQAPTALTYNLETIAPATAQGLLTITGTAAATQEGYSGDSGHSATVTIGSGTSIGSTSLCSTALCLAGTYDVHVYVDITTACGTSGTYVVSLIYTDDQGSKTIPVNLQGTGAVPLTGTLTTTSTANFGQQVQVIRSTGSASINYSTTATACGTAGPMVGKLYLAVNPVM
jgi:fibronectin-binding autotransporter adhesin